MSSLDLIVDELKTQNKTLEDTKVSIQKLLAEDIATRKERERRTGKEEEYRREAKQQRAGPSTFKEGLVKGVKDASGFNLLEQIGSWGRSILAGMFGGATAGAIGATLGQLVGRGTIFGGAALLVGKFGEQLFSKLFKELDPKDIYLNADDKQLLAASMSDAMSAGLVGLIFGKKAGIAAFVGSLIGDGLTKVLNLSDTERMKLMGFELPISEADFASYGSMIAAFFGPSLIGSAISRAFTGQAAAPGATVGRDPGTGRFTRLRPSFRQTFMANFRPRLGWAAVIATAGSLLANYIGDMTGSEEMGDVANWGVQGAALGAMFGPQGALIGAMAGFAIGGAGVLYDYIKKSDEKARAALDENLRKAQEDVDAKLAAGDIAGAAAAAQQAAAITEQTSSYRNSQAQAAQLQAAYDLQARTAAAANDMETLAQAAYKSYMTAAKVEDYETMKSSAQMYADATGKTLKAAVEHLMGVQDPLGKGYLSSSQLLRDMTRKEGVFKGTSTFSNRLDMKGSTPVGSKLSDVVGGVAGGVPIVINNVNNSQQQGPVTISKGGDTYRSDTAAPQAIDNHYSRQYMGIPGRGMCGY